MALAQGFQESRLSDFIGQILAKIVPKNNILMLIVVTLFSQIGTEVGLMLTFYIFVGNSLDLRRN